jgi:hypothetical protein
MVSGRARKATAEDGGVSKNKLTGFTGLCTAVLMQAIRDAAKEKQSDCKPVTFWLARSSKADVFFDYIDVEREYILKQMQKRGININGF